MAYDYYKNTPFDLNHDGKIDPNEAAYIHDTLHPDENSGNYKLKKSNPVPWIIFMIACFVFSSSPGLILFVAMMLISAKISRIF